MTSRAFRSIVRFLLRTQPSRPFEVSFTHSDHFFDFLISSQVGIVNDFTEVGFKTCSSFFYQFGVFISFGPEVSDWEGGELELDKEEGTLSLSRD